MAKGSQPTQTSTYQFSPEQRQLMDLAMPGVRDFAATVPQRYGSSTIAGADPLQTAGQEMALGAAGTQGQLASSGATANNFLLGDIWNPSSNSNLQGAIDATVRPITENYQQVVRPAIRDNFEAAGQQFGGSRRNIAEGLAANSYMRNVGDASSKLVQNEYDTNINAQLKALGLLPQTQAAQMAPALTTSGVGDVRQALAQALLGEQVGNFNYDQLAPFLQSKEIMSLLARIPGGTTVSTGNNASPNMAMSTLGGAASGASLGSIAGPPGMAVGAGIGALLPWLTR